MNIAALTMLGMYVVLLLAIRPFGELEDMVRAHMHGHTVQVKRGGLQASSVCFVCLFAPARRANPQFHFDLRCRLERVPHQVPLRETSPFRSTPNDVSV